MPYTIQTAVRQIVTSNERINPQQTLVLIERGFVFKNGIWSRQYRLRPLEAGSVDEVPMPGELLLRAAGQD